MTHSRYAIYWTPEGALAALGAAWLGWDAASGAVPPPPGTPPLPRPREALTAAPRKYGFHGTLKPPFRLAERATRAGLERALGDLAAGLPPVPLAGLRLKRLGRFLALVPEGRPAGLETLAARVVEALDGFRAPPDAAELARRRAAGLTERQEALLGRWGYPYVMEEFRFHLTLTGPLEDGEAEVVEPALARLFAPHLGRPLEIRDLTLLGEGEDGRFRHLARAALSG